jgi:hypothetical protein
MKFCKDFEDRKHILNGDCVNRGNIRKELINAGDVSYEDNVGLENISMYERSMRILVRILVRKVVNKPYSQPRV